MNIGFSPGSSIDLILAGLIFLIYKREIKILSIVFDILIINPDNAY